MKKKKGKFKCQYCAYRDDSQAFLMAGHAREYHPEVWTQINTEIEEEREKEKIGERQYKIKHRQHLDDEESIACPRCGGGGKLFVNTKGQERIPGEDYHE